MILHSAIEESPLLPEFHKDRNLCIYIYILYTDILLMYTLYTHILIISCLWSGKPMKASWLRSDVSLEVYEAQVLEAQKEGKVRIAD